MKILYSIFDTLLEPVFVLNAEQKVVYCNETAALLTGVSVRKITRGMKLFELFEFSEKIEALKGLHHITEPTPYKEVNFKTFHAGSGKVQLTLQPVFDAMGDKNWIMFVRDVTLEERLQAKYRGELEQKEDVIKALEDAKVQLENYSKNLEKMVAERTAELSRLNQQMTALLDSLGQGFFIFDAKGTILDVSSKACETTVESNPRGKNIWEVLKVPEKKVEGFQKWMQTVFMEMLPFEDLAPLGPTEYPHSQNRNISLEYFPLRSAEGTMEGVVVVASDITSLVEAKKQAEHDREFAKLIINLVQNKKEITRFIRESETLLADLNVNLEKPWGKADSEQIFRLLHTLKGGAALFSVQEMAEYAHQAESYLSAFNEKPNQFKFQLLQTESRKIQNAFNSFIKKSQEILGASSLSSERQLEIPMSHFHKVLTKIHTLSAESEELLRQEFMMEPIASYFTPYNDVVLRLAEKQEKQVNPVNFKNGDLKIMPETYSNLFASFIHAFRNAVDHGIEMPTVREKFKKSAKGSINVEFSLDTVTQTLKICVTDDGAGINAKIIREKLQQRGIKTDHETDVEVIQHIFDSQFSTRDHVTETSGRGVGMDAIKSAAESLGGRVWVDTRVGKGSTLRVEVPYITHFNPLKFKIAA